MLSGEMKTRMRVVVEGTDGIVSSQSHAQRICHLLDGQRAQFFNHHFIYHNLNA